MGNAVWPECFLITIKKLNTAKGMQNSMMWNDSMP